MINKASKDKKEEIYLIPELNIRVSMAWLNLITYCQNSFPHGDITITIVNSQPMRLVSQKPVIRFDKHSTIPTSEIANEF